MMHNSRYIIALSTALLAACGGPPVIADSRGPFDTTTGVYGGNEFAPLSPEGKRMFKGDKADSTQAAPVAPAPAAAPVAVAAATPAAPVALAAATPAAVPSTTRIDIDANAYGAVFGNTPAPVKPTAAQLMQLDSLSLVAADSLRVDLQTRILQCRRAGEGCRIGNR